jgi:hypothetical protein
VTSIKIETEKATDVRESNSYSVNPRFRLYKPIPAIEIESVVAKRKLSNNI